MGRAARRTRGQYLLATRALDEMGYRRALRRTISVLCGSIFVLGVIIEFAPMGPRTTPTLVAHIVVTSSAGLMAIAWWFGRWPSVTAAIAFVVWADVALTIAAGCTSSTAAQICALNHMGLIGLFITFLLGWRILVVHCVFALLVTGIFVFRAMMFEHATAFELYIYVAPVVSAVVIAPVVIQIAIEAGGRALTRIAVAARQDPLTGLSNRRDMHERTNARLRRDPGATLAVAVIDIDRFKSINDKGGHAAGDEVISGIAQLLQSLVRRDDIVARTGGDEFVVVTFLAGEYGVSSFADRLNRLQDNALDVTVSIGLAVHAPSGTPASLRAVLERADAAMYSAKAGGGGRLNVV